MVVLSVRRVDSIPVPLHRDPGSLVGLARCEDRSRVSIHVPGNAGGLISLTSHGRENVRCGHRFLRSLVAVGEAHLNANTTYP